MSRGAVWAALAFVAGAVGTLLATPVVVRALGAEQFGLYALALAVGGYAGVLDGGLGWAAGRFLARDLVEGAQARARARAIRLAGFFALVGALSVPIAVALGRGIAPGRGTSADLLFVLGAAIFAVSLQQGLCMTTLRAAERFGSAGLLAFLGIVLAPAASVVTVLAGGRLLALLTALLLVGLALLVLGWLFVRAALAGTGQEERPAPRGGLLREMVSFGGWSTVNRVVMMLMLQVDRAAVAVLGSVAGLTYYAVPANLASRVNALGGPMASLFFTRASGLWAAGQRAELGRQHARATRYLAVLAVAAATPIVGLGSRFLQLWIGPEMALQGAPVLMALTLGYALISVASLDAVALEGCGHPKVTAWVQLTFCVPAVAFGWLAAPRFGFRAVAWTVAAWLGAVALADLYLMRRLILGRRRPTRAEGRLLVRLAVLVVFGLLLCRGVETYLASLVACLLGLLGIGSVLLAAGAGIALEAEDRADLREKLAATMKWRPGRG